MSELVLIFWGAKLIKLTLGGVVLLFTRPLGGALMAALGYANSSVEEHNSARV